MAWQTQSGPDSLFYFAISKPFYWTVTEPNDGFCVRCRNVTLYTNYALETTANPAHALENTTNQSIENRTSAHARAQHCCTNLTNNNNMQHPQMLHKKFDQFKT